MKRIIYTIVAAAAIITGGVAAAAPAMASTGPSNGVQGHQMTGNKADSYPDPVFGPVQCNETQHPAFDTVSCKSTSGLPLTNVTPGQTGQIGWNSDFAGSTHPTGTLTYTVNADGTGYTGQATYPNG
jgi:hypothetical protein